MEWETLRAAYERCLKASGRSQETVAAVGGLGDQNSVSRLIRNRKLGPQVETFVRAIEGLGMKPSEFFLQVESGAKPAMPPPGGTTPPVEPLTKEHPDATTLRRWGEVFLAASAHAARAAAVRKPDRRTRKRKS